MALGDRRPHAAVQVDERGCRARLRLADGTGSTELVDEAAARLVVAAVGPEEALVRSRELLLAIRVADVADAKATAAAPRVEPLRQPPRGQRRTMAHDPRIVRAYRAIDRFAARPNGVGSGELAFERAGPDRFMSDIRLLVELVDKVGREPNERQAVEIGRLAAHFATLRRMSSSIAGLLERGESPVTEAALVKDVGTAFEREVPEMVRKLLPIEASLDDDDEYSQAMAHVLLHAPSFTLRGGTPEILRGMIARGLGLR